MKMLVATAGGVFSTIPSASELHQAIEAISGTPDFAEGARLLLDADPSRLSEALQHTAAMGDHGMVDVAQHHDAEHVGGQASGTTAQPHFGGFEATSMINDSQGFAQTCFPETVENILQLYAGDTAGAFNHSSQAILEYAKLHGMAVLTNTNEWVIPNAHHQAILSAFGVPTDLVVFNYEYFRALLDQQYPIQLGVDSAYFGNPASGSHSITLVDVKQTQNGEWYYRVLDSANPTQEWYPASVVEQAMKSALSKWNDGINGRALVCKIPAIVWPFRT